MYREHGSTAEVSKDSPTLPTVIALGGLAAVSLASQATGVNQELPSIGEAVVNSCAHPFLGYLGAVGANRISQQVFNRPTNWAKKRLSWIGATVANFGAEFMQSQLVAAPEYVNFVAANNLHETGKDYLFALGGMTLYLFQQRDRS